MTVAIIIFAIAAVVVGIGVYMAVMAGGLKLTKDHLEEEHPEIPDEDIEPLPTDVKF